MGGLPTGTVTFLFTDLEGSTRMWEERPDVAREAVERHLALLGDTVAGHGGRVFRTPGDGICAAFAAAPEAVAAATSAQARLLAEHWPPGAQIRARMALHAGAAEPRDGDYIGACLNRLGRLLAVAHGGQVLLSSVVQGLTRGALPPGASLRDLGQHRLRDLAEPERIYQLVGPGLGDGFAPLRTLENLPNNLPAQATSFVGREAAIAEVKARLAATRLLTLTGTGGAGKTRLALQVAADLLEEYPDGAWFVDLAPLADDGLVPRTVLSALGARGEADAQPLEALVEYLRSRHLLLVLDNCEHLVEACARLAATLIARCPGARLLATSREMLGVPGESAWRVPSLSVPDPRDVHTTADLATSEAARLFVERARAVDPTFAPTDANAAALARVCTRLDGIPLAIELAAARVRVMTVEQIAQRLNDRFRLLTGGGRTALRRQQTLQALVDWSHDLLSEPERVLFRRLAVFAGGFTLEAAEEVCAIEPLEAFEVLDLLTGLVDKSLVVAERHGEAERFRMLETIRQYAEDRLLQSGEAGALRDRQRDWCLALAEQALPYLTTSDQRRWLDRLEAEHDNLRAALGWCQNDEAAADVEERLAAALGRFWSMRGYGTEGIGWLEHAVERRPGAATTARGVALNWLGSTSMAYDRDRSRRAGEESVAILRAVGDPVNLSMALRHLGLTLWTIGGDEDTGRPLIEEALASARAAGDRRETAWSLNFLGQMAARRGDFDGARQLIVEGVELCRGLDPWGLSWGLIGLGLLALIEGDAVRAEALFAEAWALGEDVGVVGGMGSLIGLIDALVIQGKDEAARAHIARGLAFVHQRQAAFFLIANCLAQLAGLELAAGRAEMAAVLLGAAARWRPPGTPGMRIWQHRNSTFDRDVAATRVRLGAAAFERAWAEGQALARDEAILYGLRVLRDGDEVTRPESPSSVAAAPQAG